MPGSLKGRALRDFVGVTGLKMRHTANTDVEALPERLLSALERLGVPKEDAEAAIRSFPRKSRPAPAIKDD